MRYLRGGLIILIALLIAFAMLRSPSTGQRRVRVTTTTELQVLKVSLGTNHVLPLDPLWKRGVRRIVPAQLNWVPPARELRTRAIHPSLVLWLGNTDYDKFVGRTQISRALAHLDNGVTAPGSVAILPNGIAYLEFTTFARDQENVPISFDYLTNTIRLTVRNPKPVQRAVWKAPPLPQTNTINGTQVILLPAGRIGHESRQKIVRILTRADPPTRWFTWRMTTFDDLGNWSAKSPQNNSTVELPLLRRTNSIWKVVAEGTEYISAGFLKSMAAEGAILLSPDSRVKEYGVQAVLYVSPGSYVVTNGAALAGRSTPASNPRASPRFDSTGTNWSAQFQTTLPAILCIADSNTGEPGPRVRLRERADGNRGRVFPSRDLWSVTNAVNSRVRIATLTTSALPYDSTNVEAEIVATLAPVTFYISP